MRSMYCVCHTRRQCVNVTLDSYNDNITHCVCVTDTDNQLTPSLKHSPVISINSNTKVNGVSTKCELVLLEVS